MTEVAALPRIARAHDGAIVGLGLGPALRAALLVALLALAGLAVQAWPARAEDAVARLRGDVVARADVLTLGDLVAAVPEGLAARPLFRAPALGATGTIQTRRIVEASAALGVGTVETGGRLQITVQRAARRIGAGEIEEAIRRALAGRAGIDPAALTISFEGETPQLLVPPELTDAAVALETTFDPRSRRVTALVSVGARQASLRVAGTAVETVEVAVLRRALARGAAVAEGDVALERRPRDSAVGEARSDPAALVGQVATRPLLAGAVLRGGDLAKPELVARGEPVTLVYEAPGVSLSLRGRANEGGALGDVVGVVNLLSKKTVQGTVVGPGRVSVGPAPVPGRLASAGQP